ncbi:MAG: GNAT family N-acetyltransferase [SAR324 cluster bacterium]
MNPTALSSTAPAGRPVRFAIVDALTSAQVEQVRGLFVEYAQSLNFSLCFQGFDAELAGLPWPYARPAGRLLLGLQDGRPTGCVGLRPLELGVCEMKRLYVKPEARRTGLGPWLAHRAVTEAEAEGHHTIRLDTLVHM